MSDLRIEIFISLQFFGELSANYLLVSNGLLMSLKKVQIFLFKIFD